MTTRKLARIVALVTVGALALTGAVAATSAAVAAENDRLTAAYDAAVDASRTAFEAQAHLQATQLGYHRAAAEDLDTALAGAQALLFDSSGRVLDESVRTGLATAIRDAKPIGLLANYREADLVEDRVEAVELAEAGTPEAFDTARADLKVSTSAVLVRPLRAAVAQLTVAADGVRADVAAWDAEQARLAAEAEAARLAEEAAAAEAVNSSGGGSGGWAAGRGAVEAWIASQIGPRPVVWVDEPGAWYWGTVNTLGGFTITLSSTVADGSWQAADIVAHEVMHIRMMGACGAAYLNYPGVEAATEAAAVIVYDISDIRYPYSDADVAFAQACLASQL